MQLQPRVVVDDVGQVAGQGVFRVAGGGRLTGRQVLDHVAGVNGAPLHIAANAHTTLPGGGGRVARDVGLRPHLLALLGENGGGIHAQALQRRLIERVGEHARRVQLV